MLCKVDCPREFVYSADGKPTKYESLSVPLFVLGYMKIMDIQKPDVRALMSSHLTEAASIRHYISGIRMLLTQLALNPQALDLFPVRVLFRAADITMCTSPIRRLDPQSSKNTNPDVSTGVKLGIPHSDHEDLLKFCIFWHAMPKKHSTFLISLF